MSDYESRISLQFGSCPQFETRPMEKRRRTTRPLSSEDPASAIPQRLLNMDFDMESPISSPESPTRIDYSKRSRSADELITEAAQKKRHRRTAAEIERSFLCEVCNKAYGSVGALNMHSKLKHSKPTPRSNASLIMDPEVTKKLNAMDINKPLWKTSVPIPVRASSPVFENSQSHLSSSPNPVPARMSFAPAQDPMLGQQPPLMNLLAPKPRYSSVPVLNMKIGAWQKNSVFCGDIIAKFSFEERKFVWEIYNLNQSFSKVEIPFDDVTHLKCVVLPDGIASLLMETSSVPMFFAGTIVLHKPPTWTSSSDFMKGGAITQHVLYFLSESLSLPFQHLLKVEPRFRELLARAEMDSMAVPAGAYSPGFAVASGVDQMFVSMMTSPHNNFASEGTDHFSSFLDPAFASLENFIVQNDPESSQDVSCYFNPDFSNQQPLPREIWSGMNYMHPLSVNH